MRHEDFLVVASPSLQRRGHEKYACHSLIFSVSDTLLDPHADFDEEVDKMLLKRVPGSEERLKGEVFVVVSPFSLIKRREIDRQKKTQLQNKKRALLSGFVWRKTCVGQRLEKVDYIDYCYHRHPSSQMLIATFEDSMMTLFEPLLISFNLLTSLL